MLAGHNGLSCGERHSLRHRKDSSERLAIASSGGMEKVLGAMTQLFQPAWSCEAATSGSALLPDPAAEASDSSELCADLSLQKHPRSLDHLARPECTPPLAENSRSPKVLVGHRYVTLDDRPLLGVRNG